MGKVAAGEYHAEFGHKKFIREALRLGNSMKFMHDVCQNQKCDYRKIHGPFCEQRVRNAETCSCVAVQTKIVHLAIRNHLETTVVGDAFVKLEGDTVTITATITDPNFEFRVDKLEHLMLGSLTNKVG